MPPELTEFLKYGGGFAAGLLCYHFLWGKNLRDWQNKIMAATEAALERMGQLTKK